jgi:hypothetical protein
MQLQQPTTKELNAAALDLLVSRNRKNAALNEELRRRGEPAPLAALVLIVVLFLLGKWVDGDSFAGGLLGAIVLVTFIGVCWSLQSDWKSLRRQIERRFRDFETAVSADTLQQIPDAQRTAFLLRYATHHETLDYLDCEREKFLGNWQEAMRLFKVADERHLDRLTSNVNDRHAADGRAVLPRVAANVEWENPSDNADFSFLDEVQLDGQNG